MRVPLKIAICTVVAFAFMSGVQAQAECRDASTETTIGIECKYPDGTWPSELDLTTPKKLDESELLKCYEMKNDNNVRQCIEILQYPNPVVRQLRQAQLLKAQQEYLATRAAQERKEQQELYRMQQGQTQKRSLEVMPPIEYGR